MATSSNESGLKLGTCIVTGANTGIGRASALSLAQNGYDVILACRSAEKGCEAEDSIRASLKEAAEEGVVGPSVRFLALDLSSFKSVRKFASKFMSESSQLALLVNNAGISSGCTTEDGFQAIWQVNYLAHFYLVQLLMPALVAFTDASVAKGGPVARVVNLSSVMHRHATAEWESYGRCLKGDREGGYKGCYQASKLAMLLFSTELSRRTHGKVIGVAPNPGFVYSDIWRRDPLWKRKIYSVAALSCEQAAKVVLFASTQPAEEVEGRYISPYWFPSSVSTYVSSFFDYLGPFGGARVMPPTDMGCDPLLALRLWDYSEKCLSELPVDN